MDSKKVSVIVPCYNMEKYLSETLDSVLKQTYENWECIIVDDGSVDNTAEIAFRYCQKDYRFKYMSKTNSGVVDARNAGIRNTSGYYILPLDGDDLISEEYIAKCVAVFEEEPNTVLVYCRAQFIGEESGEWKLEDYSYEKLLYCNIIFCSAMYKRTDFDKSGGYNQNMVLGLEDWDFWLTLLDKDSLVVRINEILFSYRIRNRSRNWIVNNSHFEKLGRQLYLNHKKIYDEFLNPARDFRNLELMEMKFISQKKKTKKYKKLFLLSVATCAVLLLLNIFLLLQ